MSDNTQAPIAPPTLPADWRATNAPINKPARDNRAAPPDKPVEQPTSQNWQKKAEPIAPYLEDVVARPSQIANLGLQKANSRAADQRYTFQHRAETIVPMLQGTADEILATKTADLKDLTTRLAALEEAGRENSTPDAADLPVLAYLRDKLEIDWKRQTVDQFVAGYEDAIKHKDLHQIRIYRDFGRDKFIGRRGDMLRAEDRQRLDAAATDMLLAPEQRKSRADYLVLRETIYRYGIAANAALSMVTNAYYDPMSSTIRSKNDVLRKAGLRE